MITNNTKNVLTVLIAFSDNSGLEQYMSEATKILENYVGATNISTYISKGKQE